MKLARRSILFGFSGIGALLAGLLVYEITAPLPEFTPPVIHLKPKAQRAQTVVAVSTPAAEAFAEIDARPMFNPSRKAVAAAGTGETALKPPQVTLVGVIVDRQDSIAMLKTPSSPLATAYRVGATISGWQLTEISPVHVVLSAGGSRDEIRLDANRAPATPGAPPPTSQ